MSSFKQKIQSKHKTTKKRKLPFQTDAVFKMRKELTKFISQYPKCLDCMVMTNPYYKVAYKYLTSEDLLQIVCCSYLKNYHPEIAYFHPKNEGKESNVGAAKKKLLGVMEGVSDLVLVLKGKVVFVELKVAPNKPSKKQLEFIERQKELGNEGFVIWDIWEFVELVKSLKK